MKALFFFLFITIPPYLAQTNCTTGCLKCVVDQCTVCDPHNLYMFQAGACVQVDAPNCLEINKFGVCTTCKYKYVLSIATNTCEAATAQTRIKYCVDQTSQGCRVCQPNRYVQDGQCMPVKVRIPGCLINSENLCEQCSEDLVLHPSKERCVHAPPHQNCMSYGYLECERCEEGFVQNPNYFAQKMLSNKDLGVSLKFLQKAQKGENNGFMVPGPCEPILPTLDQCEYFESADKCKKCRPNHFLTKDQQCAQFPIPRIENCARYSNYNVCVECQPEHHLFNQQTCYPVTPITNCQDYDTTSSAIVCKRCSNDYMLQSNTCIARHATDVNCTYRVATSNDCEVCADGYGLTTDKRCLSLVQNCAVYEVTTTTNSLVCKTCSDKFYLSNKACVAGDKTSCLQYSSQNVCSKCENGWYWNTTNASCTEHTPIPDCQTYSGTEANVCVQCNNKNILFNQIKACVAVTKKVQNCVQYSDLTVCASCKPGFYLNNNLCAAIPADKFCQVIVGTNENECSTCNSGYVLTTAKACIRPMAFQTQNCLRMSNLKTKYFCDECKEGTYPWRYNREQVCISMEEKKNYYGGSNSIVDCELYSHTVTSSGPIVKGSTHICLKCKNGKFPNLLKTQCVTTCDFANNEVIALDQIFNQFSSQTLVTTEKSYIKYKGCYLAHANDQLANCEIAAPVTGKMIIATPTAANQNFFCVKCRTDKQYVKVFDKKMHTSLVSYNWEDLSAGKRFGYLYHGFKCLDNSGGGALVYKGTNNGTPPQNCDIFHKGTQLECRKCKFGYSGVMRVNNDDLNCEKKVINCNVNEYYGGLFWNDAIHSENFNKNYLNCHSCIAKSMIPFVFMTDPGSTTAAALTRILNKFDIKYGTDAPFDATTFINSEAHWVKCLKPSAKAFRMPESKYTAQFPSNCGFGSFAIDEVKQFITTDYSKYAFDSLQTVSDYDKVEAAVKTKVTKETRDTGVTNGDSEATITAAIITALASVGTTNRINVAKATVTAAKPFLPFFPSLQCLYCKPGYRAVRSLAKYISPAGNNVIGIQRCEKIQNCVMKSESKWFNSCAQCAQGYAWENIDLAKPIVRFDRCVPTNDDYCMVWHTTATDNIGPIFADLLRTNNQTVGQCIFCRKGYSLNIDGRCVVMQAPLCANNQYQNQVSSYKNVNSYSLQLYDLIDLNVGCNECKSGYIRFFDTIAQHEACSTHEYLLLPYNYEGSELITNCRTYFKKYDDYVFGNATTAVLQCKTCKPNYILSLNNLKCLQQDAFPGCKTVNNPYAAIDGVPAGAYNKCEVCLPGFHLLLGYCERGTIKQCKKYDATKTVQKCEECEDRFQYEDGNCVPGRIPYCKSYRNYLTPKECESCQDGYKMVDNANSSQYCVKLPAELNCRSQETHVDNSNNPMNHKIICDCDESNFIDQTEDKYIRKSMCLGFEEVAFCQQYHNTNTIHTSTYDCAKCEYGYFLKNNKCMVRENNTVRCEIFKNDADYCEKCIDGSYLTNDKQCELYPTGIVNCVFYKDAQKCLECDKNHYLQTSADGTVTNCTMVKLAQRIKNCREYKDPQTCKKCSQNFYIELDKNFVTSCVPAKAMNCREYDPSSKGMKCSKCNKGYGFQDDFEKKTINCTFISSPNCLENSVHFPFECLKCERLYFISTGKCISVRNFIENCEIYEYSDECMKCDSGYILTVDRRECKEKRGFLMPFDDCESNMETKFPVCQACDFGHQFDHEGNCIRCKVQTLESGCMFCRGREDTETCVSCRPGFFMHTDGKCYTNGSTPPVATP